MAFKGWLAVYLVALCAIPCVQGFTVPTLPALNAARRLGYIGTVSASSSSVGARSTGISMLGSRRVAVQLRGPSMRLSDNAMQLGDKSTGGASVLDRPSVVTAPTPDDVAKVDPKKPYHVLLFNDPMNTREYVCEALNQVFGHSKSQAYTIMQTAHSTGFAVCNTTDKKEADSQSAELGNLNLMSSVVEAS